MFNINDKVVCINDKFNENAAYVSPKQVKKGEVYCIRDVWSSTNSKEGTLIQLVGFPEVTYPQGRCGWTPSRFRKVSEVGHPKVNVYENVE